MNPAYRIEHWLSEKEIRATAYSDYWNNEQIENLKPWDVLEHGFSALTRHLEETGLRRQLEDCLDSATRHRRPLRGIGADLGCGVFWTAPLLLQQGIDKVYGVEYSKHRLLKIGPRVLDHYAIPPDKVVLCLGSFYDLQLSDQQLDFVVLAEAFHHADDPERLLREIRRVLKADGVVLILGEHIMAPETLLYARHIAKSVASRVIPLPLQHRLLGRTISTESFLPSLREILKPDVVMGDHYYLPREYREMFSSYGFQYERIKTQGCPFQAFVLY